MAGFQTNIAGRRKRGERWLGVTLSAIVHGGIVAALLSARVSAPVVRVQPAIAVEIFPTPPAPATKPVVAATASSPSKPAPVVARSVFTRPAPAPRDVAAVAVASAPVAGIGAGGGHGSGYDGSGVAAELLAGGECDMARRLQTALKRDGLVRAAVAARGGAGGRGPILVWDGGWVASDGEDGHGLAAVREAIVWEVAFAPASCRQERVHGPVLFTVSDAAGLARIALGAGDWRWGDLVSSR